jgi:dihydroorotate dehydrogenase
MSSAARLISRLALPILQRLDPELAHTLALRALAVVQPTWREHPPAPALAVRVCGLTFAHPLGLAAGFDKSGDHLDALGAFGFSHVELGTVTPRPQPGNPRPRLFRARAAAALVNRMGFNNAGVDHLTAAVAHSRYAGIRGISIGKNFDTPLEKAEDDYRECLRKAYEFADYIAVNVSSPNTARLRELQDPAGLERIVAALLEARLELARRHGKRVPLLVKLAPDLSAEQLAAIAAQLRTLGVDGVIATNTSTDLSALGRAWPAAQKGGLSGAPLHAKSLSVIRQLRAGLGPDFPIIGVGGIMSGADALAMLEAGANLIQIYTGFVYRGEALIEEILDALERRGG